MSSTSTFDLKPGTRVRAVIEGEVVDSSDQLYFIGGGAYLKKKEVVSLEVIEPAKPEWWPPRPGDVVLVSATAYVLDYEGNARYLESGGAPEMSDSFADWLVGWATRHPGRSYWHQVKLLVRNRKAVAG